MTKDSGQTEDRSARIRRAAKVAAVYTLLGPPLGAVVAIAYGASYQITIFPTVAAAVADVLRSVVDFGGLVPLYIYMLGGLPALLTGLAIGYHVYTGDGSVTLLRALAVAVVATIIATFLFEVVAYLGMPKNGPTMAPVLLLPAVFATAVCHGLLRVFGVVAGRSR